VRTVTIKVHGEVWQVPYGFGRSYVDEAIDPADAKTLRDIMNLVGWDPDPQDVETWPLRMRVEAVVYCGREHLSASDNPVQRHPVPEWLRGIEPWKGDDRGVWGPAPTPFRRAS